MVTEGRVDLQVKCSAAACGVLRRAHQWRAATTRRKRLRYAYSSASCTKYLLEWALLLYFCIAATCLIRLFIEYYGIK